MKKINVLLSTFFGYGYLTKIPGTVTSAVTTIFIYIAYEILGFIEDRKKTLIDIKQNSETSHIPCFLADRGYLKESDKYTLSNEIKLLKLVNLEELVAF